MKRKLFWLPLTILIILSGAVLMFFCVGHRTVPLSQKDARQAIEDLRLFDANEIKGISGERYRCGFWTPNLYIHFTIPETAIKIAAGEKQKPHYGPPNLGGLGVPATECWDYCWIGMATGKYMGVPVCTYGKYCIVTPPDKLGMVDVYYILSGGP